MVSTVLCVTFFLTGGFTGSNVGSYVRDEVLAWLDEEQQWVEEGNMKVATGYHAVTTIQLDDDALALCG